MSFIAFWVFWHYYCYYCFLSSPFLHICLCFHLSLFFLWLLVPVSIESYHFLNPSDVSTIPLCLFFSYFSTKLCILFNLQVDFAVLKFTQYFHRLYTCGFSSWDEDVSILTCTVHVVTTSQCDFKFKLAKIK